MTEHSRRRVASISQEAINMAIAASALAGFEITQGVRDLLARIDRGELTEDEAIEEVKARHTRPADD